jgi:hypothetical protein
VRSGQVDRLSTPIDCDITRESVESPGFPRNERVPPLPPITTPVEALPCVPSTECEINRPAMTETPSKTKILLAWLAGLLVVAFILLGAIGRGISAEEVERLWRNVVDRPGGPMTFRFVLQPVMAAIAAYRDGVRDGRTGRSPYFWTVVTSRSDRVERLREGFVATGQIILLGLAMDTIYQVIVLKAFYPAEAAIVALLLAFLPYLLLRGPIARVTRWRHGETPSSKAL